MARPKKCRRVCFQPRISEFMPDVETDCSIILTVDEYESIRLIDRLALSQEECAQYMQVARTTVQQIYNSARVKIATALVEGKRLRISGGDYTLCDGSAKLRACGCCGNILARMMGLPAGRLPARSSVFTMQRNRKGINHELGSLFCRAAGFVDRMPGAVSGRLLEQQPQASILADGYAKSHCRSAAFTQGV